MCVFIYLSTTIADLQAPNHPNLWAYYIGRLLKNIYLLLFIYLFILIIFERIRTFMNISTRHDKPK